MGHIDGYGAEYQVRCATGHELNMTPSEFQDLLDDRGRVCEQCDAPLELLSPSQPILECFICSELYIVSSLEEASALQGGECRGCEGHGFGTHTISVPRSVQSVFLEHEWSRWTGQATSLLRPSRTDYWEGLVHFCDEREFASITREGVLRAAVTGHFKRPAVCLTEVPQGNWTEMRRVHGEFGLVFRKRDVLMVGGGPAVYLPDRLIADQQLVGFSEALKPFVTVLRTPAVEPKRKKHDFLHEREWRVPCDLILDETKPYAIVLGPHTIQSPHIREILEATLLYPELSTDGDLVEGEHPLEMPEESLDTESGF